MAAETRETHSQSVPRTIELGIELGRFSESVDRLLQAPELMTHEPQVKQRVRIIGLEAHRFLKIGKRLIVLLLFRIQIPQGVSNLGGMGIVSKTDKIRLSSLVRLAQTLKQPPS